MPIRAVPKDCYRFIEWRDVDDNFVSANQIDTIILISDSILVAHFVRDSFNLTLNVIPEGAGSINCNEHTISNTFTNRYACGDMVNIEAIENECFEFVHWVGTYVLSDQSVSITILTDIYMTAIFVDTCSTDPTDTFTLTLNSNNNEFGAAIGGGKYPANRKVTIRAVPEDCYRFIEWRDKDNNFVSANQVETIILVSDSILVAHFVRDSFNLALNVVPKGAGSIKYNEHTASNEVSIRFECGEVVNLEAIANDCFEFMHWEGTYTSSEPLTSITILSNTYITAIFVDTCDSTPIDTFTLTLSSDNIEGGTALGGGRYPDNSKIPIRAVPEDCYRFVEWRNKDGNFVSANQVDTVILVSDSVLVAHFEKERFELILEVYPKIAGTTIFHSGFYYCGELIDIEAFADDCYKFSCWMDNANKVISSNSTHQIVLKSDSVLTAQFMRDSFELVLNVHPEGGGTAIRSGKQPCGVPSEIRAVAAECFEFVSWTDANGNMFSDKEIEEIIITDNTTLTANFEFICPLKLTFIASNHDAVDPKATNYPIPFFIKSNKDISNISIPEIKISINKNIFYPKNVDKSCFMDVKDGITSIKNIHIPSLKMNVETPLFTISGNALLGDVDSSPIKFIDVVLQDETDFELIDGYINIDICRLGGDRLARVFDYSPSITIIQNPITDLLEIECKVIEVGNYTLEIVDMSGQSTIIKKWFISKTSPFEFTIEVPVLDYSSGNYIILMRSPSEIISEKFIIKR